MTYKFTVTVKLLGYPTDYVSYALPDISTPGVSTYSFEVEIFDPCGLSTNWLELDIKDGENDDVYDYVVEPEFELHAIIGSRGKYDASAVYQKSLLGYKDKVSIEFFDTRGPNLCGPIAYETANESLVSHFIHI